MKTLYILQLQEDKFYIGTTARPLEDRIEEHFAAAGSEWTRRYSPVLVTAIIDNVDDFEEDKQVKIFMSRYGIDNVRGGSYSQLTLPDFQRQALQQEFASATNVCFTCGKLGHYAADCKPRCTGDGSCFKYVSAGVEKRDDIICDRGCQVSLCSNRKHFLPQWMNGNCPTCTRMVRCFRCNRIGHLAEDCGARGRPVCYRCGRDSHLSPDCFAHTDIYGNKLR